MKRLLGALAVASAVLAGCQTDLVAPPAARVDRAPAAASPTTGIGDVIPGQYVVLFRRERVVAGPAASRQLAERKLAGGRGELRRSFGHAVRGFAARLTDSAAAALRADPDVALVEPDHVVRATASGIEGSAPWGLDRIDQPSLPLDGLYHYPGDGSGTSVYIVDTGINLTHAEFGGRAVTGTDFVTPGGTAVDCQGHGTHVAGIVGGASYGVAKNVRLVAVRVLDCSGSGSGSNVIAALDWVAQQKAASPATPMVVNMSLGGSAAAVIDSAVQRTVAAGVTVVVAAGNSGADACGTSPARAPGAIAVGATDSGDGYANFSNYGTCVALAAPGVAITSAYIGSNTATAVMSGTSMASPHVAGAAALYLAANPSATPAQVAAALTSHAAAGPIQALPANTPSRVLNVTFLAGQSTGTPSPGSPSTGTLSNPATGACLTLPGSGANSAPLTTAACAAGSGGQQWTVSAAGTSGSITAYAGSLCVDDYGAGGRAGDVVGTWGCNGQANQRWTLTSAGTLVGINGLCLAAPASAGAASVTLQPCNGSSAQQWVLGAASATRFTSLLKTAASGRCLDVRGASQDAGTIAIAWDCSGAANQQWSLPAVGSAGEVRVYGARCLDDFGAGGNDGDVIGIWTCNGQANQQWTLTSAGQLRGINGKCVAVADATNGAAVRLQSCAGGATQTWTAPGVSAGAVTVAATRRAVGGAG